MVQKILIPTVLVIFLFTCCEKEIEISNNKFVPHLVVNSILNCDTTFIVQLSQTSIIYDTSNTELNNAQVGLWIDNQFSGTLNYNDNGKYVSSIDKPIPGHHYMIKVNSPGYDEVSAYDSIPLAVSLNDAYFIFPAGTDIAGDPYMEFVLNFDDPPEIENYYEAIFYTKSNVLTNYLTNDSITSINYLTSFISNDPVLIEEGDMDYNPASIFFADKLFNGKNVTITAKAYNFGYGFDNGQIVSPGKYKVVEFRSISRAYYQYRKSWTRHLYNQGIKLDVRDSEELREFLFTGEPVNMYSNIENGYGIFVGYSKSIFIMRVAN